MSLNIQAVQCAVENGDATNIVRKSTLLSKSTHSIFDIWSLYNQCHHFNNRESGEAEIIILKGIGLHYVKRSCQMLAGTKGAP